MEIPIWISNKHIHLTKEDANKLFGEKYKFNKVNNLSQTWQYATIETLNIKWPKWTIEDIRIILPFRKETQIEILKQDSFKLWIDTPIRLSWDLANTPGIKIIGPKWEVDKKKWLIIAQRHLHISQTQAKKNNIKQWDILSIKTKWIRSITFHNVQARISKDWNLDFHIDREEAHAAGITQNTTWMIIQEQDC